MNRLLVSLVVFVVVWVFAASIWLVGQWLLAFAGVWFVIESIFFGKKNWKDKGYRPLISMAGFLSLQVLLILFLMFLDIFIDLPSDILQGFALWYVVSAVVFLVFGIWAIVKGIVLIRSKKNVRLGVVDLVMGIIVTLPVLIFLGGLAVSLIDLAVNGPDVIYPVR